MKQYIAVIAIALGFLSATGQEATRVRIGDNQNFGITYNLPSLRLRVQADAVCTTFKAGVFAQYAEKYLGLRDVQMADAKTWDLTHVSMSTEVVSDTSRSYHIVFNEKMTLPTIYLVNDRLASINREPALAASTEEQVIVTAVEKNDLHAVNVMSEELLKAGSKSKQAEIAARQIFRIRESRLNLLTGDVDNLPADGASFQLVLDNLKAQEEAYMELFTGVTTTSTQHREYTYSPEEEGNQILFRFSRHFGFVESDDLSGEPIKLSLEITDDKRSVPVLLDAKGKVKPVATGIAYTVPGKARVELRFKGECISQGEWLMGQFGHVEYLSVNYFVNKKAPASALFDTTTGAIQLFQGE